MLVCVSEDPRAAGLVRYAKRLADRLHAPWTALYVETKRSLQLTEEERDRVADTLRLAQALGGEPVTIPGGDRRIADDVIAYAQANNITQVIVGKSTRSRWFELLTARWCAISSRACGNISVHVIAGEEIAGEPIPKKTVRAAERHEPVDPKPYIFALLGVGAAVGVSELLWPWIGTREHRPRVPHGNRRHCRSLRLVAFAPRQRGVGALLQFLLHCSRYHTFSIADPRNVVAFVFFTIVAITVSNVAARVRTQAVTAMARARTTEALYVFSRKLAGVGTLDDVLWATAYQIGLDAEGAGRAAAAGGRHDRRQGRLSA